jgi:hypothetical protein
MKKFYLLLFLALGVFTLSACSDKSDDDRLEQEKMAQVLADVHIDEAIVQNMNVGSTDTAVVLFHEISKQSFKKRGLDSATVSKSLASYVKDPAAFIKLYTRVNEIIEERRVKAVAKRK